MLLAQCLSTASIAVHLPRGRALQATYGTDQALPPITSWYHGAYLQLALPAVDLHTPRLTLSLAFTVIVHAQGKGGQPQEKIPIVRVSAAANSP